MKMVTPPTDAPSAPEAAEPDETEETPARGRPRSADRTPAILHAVIELIDEDGYDRLTIQDVADRAGVGLATIYRRWPTKQDLVVEALRAKVGRPARHRRHPSRPAHHLHADGRRRSRAAAPNWCPGCLAVARDEPEILQALRDNALCGVRDHLRMLIAREVGDDDPDLDLRVDFGPGVLLQRAMLLGEPMDDPAELARLVDVALRPGRAPPTAADRTSR